MLRIVQQNSVAAAQSYYTHLAESDYVGYYADGQERPGRWGGRGADRLGLSGDVTSEAFQQLCENQHPITGERLTARTKGNRTVGYDFNFHAPKSVSVVHELTLDERIVSAFRAAVDETMRELEADIRTRVRTSGQVAERTTGNLVWGEFVHHTARPVDGRPDPHLHAHCFVFNATYDAAEHRWKAGQFRPMKADAPYFEAAFHARLAGQLADLGYGIRWTEVGWELAGIPESVTQTFSRRTERIEAEARQRGIKDARLKDGLGAKTRERKSTERTRSELRREWDARLTPGEQAAVAMAAQAGEREPGNVVTPEQALAFATDHHLERASVVGERELLRTTLRYGVGSVDVEAAHRQLAESDLLRRKSEDRTYVTSPGVLLEEQRMLAYARAGRGTRKPLVGREREIQRSFLSAEQQAAVKSIWRSPDAVIAIRGAAGVGKTTLMLEAVEGIEAQGRKVFTFAPSAQASRGVLRGEGFSTADTVAKLLQDETLQQAVRGQVLWIDEAGLLGTKTLHQVFELAEKSEARVVLTGDSRQHGAVERGDSLRLLERHAGIVPAEVTEIKRQRGDYKHAVHSLATGRTVEGFDQLDRLGSVRELSDDQRYQNLATDYRDALQRGKKCLIIAPTHAEGRQVTETVRDELRHAGLLEVRELGFTRLQNRQWTEAERRDAVRYQVGDVVQFVKPAPGFCRGDRCPVSAVEQNSVLVEHRGEVVALPLSSAAAFQVYAAEPLGVSVGERIRITQNGQTRDGKHRLNNGAQYQVQSMTPRGDLKLSNGWIVAREFGHIDHGYCVTSHGSQGATVDCAFVAQSSASGPASSQEQFYVSCSRAKERVTIYTDNKQDLRDAIQHSTRRLSATELLAEPETPKPPTWRERAWEQVQRVQHYARQVHTHVQHSWQQWRDSWNDRTLRAPQREFVHE
jgi:conjugative relaxase-like TrwC/TraI family protein